ncbi:hypothetical protein ACJMK2_004542 [Sinanodonta woodiana]|uniref:TIR domain-containing protein n=1 Tax=Sinanodonta woodiana TaxID=1069815 RepID=A0ABD3Y1H6_SINWO
MGSASSVEAHPKATSVVSAPQKIVVPAAMENEKKSQPEKKEEIVDGEKILTEEEVKIRKDVIFKALNETIDSVKQIPGLRTEDGQWNADLLKGLRVFSASYFSIKNIGSLPYDVIQKYRREAGQRLSESKSTSVMCKVIMDGWKRGYRNEEGKTDAHQLEGLSKSLLTLLNYSDCTPEVTYDIAGEPDFLETITGILTTILPKHMKGEAKNDDENVMKWCLSIYHNTSMVDQNIPRLRSLEIVPVFNSILDAKKEIYRLSALSTLANIIDEKESAILQDKHDVVAFLLKTLESAVKDPNHRNLGWSAQECAMTVRCLARNDANKKLLVEMGCLPHLVDLAKSGNDEEQRESFGAIWVLAFEKENHRKILDDTKLNIIDLLVEFKEKSSDKEVRKAIDGTLWILREELQKNNKYKHIVSSFEQKNRPKTAAKKSSGSSGTPVKDGKGHIMISYNWSHQKELVKIRDLLKEHGYAVWMDIDNMGGSTLQAMAEAVEHAHTILICMSQKYKDSPNCRAEAEYAFQLRKKIIPLKMERGYQPDGWLGFLIGAKLFYEFSGKYAFEAKIKELIREISSTYGNEDAEPKIVPVKSQREETMDTVDSAPVAVTMKPVYSAPPPPVAVVRKWTPSDVNRWIEKHNLPKKNFEKLTGRELALLVTMRLEAPEFFYNYLQKNLGISSLLTMAMFIEGLEDLST